MTQASPILALPYLMPSQAQKHVTHNEALQMLDALVQLSAEGFEAATPPASPLAVSGPATLLSHAGAGHQLKINKSASAETASLLFQSNWSGRAEIGLAGSNDFAVKLSDDGSSWSTALALKPNGRAGFGTASPAAHLEIRGSSDDYLLAGDGGGADFRLGSDGNGSCSDAWSGGGADYAEWFEWADGNPAGKDRRGLSVVLEGAKIRAANAGETPFGVISANPAVIGDGDMDGWKHRWLRDAYGALLRDADGNPQENPAYDASRPYVPREARPEWALTGLLGKLRLRQGQPAAPGWIRMRQAGPGLEEWLVR